MAKTDGMSGVLGLLGSLSSSQADNSEMSGSFQSGFGGASYDYGSGSGVDRNDHYGGHSGYHHHSGDYHDDKCCPLVVDALCLAAILGAIAGATVLLQRAIQVELCMVNGAAVALFVANCRAGRRKRSDIERPWWHGPLLRLVEGKNKELRPCMTRVTFASISTRCSF